MSIQIPNRAKIAKGSWRAVANETYRRAMRTSPARGLEFNLTKQEFAEIIERSKGFCEVTGIPFSYRCYGFKTNPWGPSLDRIDPTKGYTFKNCRIVCKAANFAMNQWGDKVLKIMARVLMDEKYRLDLQAGNKWLPLW